MTSRAADSLDILRSFAPGTALRAAVDLGGFPEEPAARERIALLEAQGGSSE